MTEEKRGNGKPRYCAACGTETLKPAKFCSECGAPVEVVVLRDPVRNWPPEIDRRVTLKMRKAGPAAIVGMMMVVGVLVVIAVVWGVHSLVPEGGLSWSGSPTASALTVLSTGETVSDNPAVFYGTAVSSQPCRIARLTFKLFAQDNHEVVVGTASATTTGLSAGQRWAFEAVGFPSRVSNHHELAEATCVR